MKTRTSALMPVLAALALTAGCSDLQDDAMLAQAAATETAYVNGRIYTQDEDRPWAESLVTKGDRIVFVGSDEEALEHAAEDARLVDLQNRFVMPGVIDAHTHPGLIATGADLSVLDAVEGNETPANADRMPSRPREATLAWLRQYAFPINAIRYCLDEAGIAPEALDYVGFYDKPFLKLERLLETYLSYAPRGFRSFLRFVPLWAKQKLHLPREIARGLGGYRRQIVFAEHHESHAASAFFPSPFDEAAILTLDGVGEWATTTYGVGHGNRIELTHEIRFPHSLGLL